jgi:hypothetical protein
VVAVNRAIQFADVIPFDCWATLDDPRHLWSWAQPHLHPRAKLFSSDGAPNILFWRDLLGDEQIQRLYTATPTYMDELKDSEGYPPMLPTLFHVLAWLLRLGVKRVRLVGCDMRGTGSPIAAEWREAEVDGWDYRWEIERELLRLSERKYRAAGARIERWNPSV